MIDMIDMIGLYRCSLAVLLSCLVAGVPRAAETTGLAEERAFRAAVARVADAVVRIETAGISAAGSGAAEAVPASGPSTGLVIDPAGWIVTTSFAVPDDLDQAVVVFAGAEAGAASRVAARVVGRDRSRGLVLLQVESPQPLAAVTAAVPRETLAVGQWTIAVGRGWNAAAPNVAVGVLSATNRAWGKAVQTDAAVSPANYGGPLIDIRGDVIGLLAPLPADTAGMNAGTELYDSGIGFAVPLEDVIRVLPRLKSGATLVPGVLGIFYRSQDAFTGAATIATSRLGSPAAKAGLRAGDTIVEAAGRPITRIAELRHALLPRYAGDAIDLVVERPQQDGPSQRITARVTLAETLPPWRRAIVGIVPRRTAAAADGGPQPVVVDWVWPGSPADAAGITAGMTVEAVTIADDGSVPVSVESIAALVGVLGGADVGQRVTLTVRDSDGNQSQRTLATAVMPTDVPAETPVRPESPDVATIVKLEAPEVATPPLAVIPSGDKSDPVGVLIYLGPPRGPIEEGEAAAWKAAANRYGVAVILPGSADPEQWSRGDIGGIARSLDSLRARRAIDRSRLAVAGTGAGGSFAWLLAEALGPAIRGVAMIDAALPRQARVAPVEPGRFRWVLLGSRSQGSPAIPQTRLEADRKRLGDAGYDVGTLPKRVAGKDDKDGKDDKIDTTPTETLCSFVEALGVL